jgi:hypothetical protein
VLKWRLMLTTLPYVAFVLLIKFGIELGIGWKGIIEFSDAGMVFTGGIFLIGFMLAGTMSDFKESEKLPGELACTFETLEEIFAQGCASRGADVTPFRRALLESARSIDEWLHRKIETPAMYEALTRLGLQGHELERTGAGGYASRIVSELHSLRRLITRVAVISRTGFLPSGYALLETLTGAIFILLLISRFKSYLAEFILVAFVTLIYTYMVRLIRDVDDPFEYHAGKQRGAAEVDLAPLTDYLARLEARLATAPPLVDTDRRASAG